MRQVQAEVPSTSFGAAALFRDACLLIRDLFLYALPGALCRCHSPGIGCRL